MDKKAVMDQVLDNETQTAEQKDFVCFAHRHRQPPVYAPIQQAAVNVKRIKTVLNG
jgi:hypothetical protein